MVRRTEPVVSLRSYGRRADAVAGAGFRPHRGGGVLAGARRSRPSHRLRHALGAPGRGRPADADGAWARSVGAGAGPRPRDARGPGIARRFPGAGGVRGARRGWRIPLAVALGRGPAVGLRRAGAARGAPGAGHARLPREPGGTADRGGRVLGGEAGRGHLPRRPGGSAGDRPGDGSVRVVRAADDGLDVGTGAPSLGAHPVDPLVGPRLLPDLHGGAPGTHRLHVRAAGGHACAGTARGLRRRAPQGGLGAAEAERSGAGHHDGRPARMGRTRRRVRVGAVARGHPHVRQDVRGGAAPGPARLLGSARRSSALRQPAQPDVVQPARNVVRQPADVVGEQQHAEADQ